MLIELRIRDLAVIHDLTVELGPGLNVLSGETGAGKSIVVGALSLLLGERASSDTVRTGRDRAVVEAVFDVSGMPGIPEALEEAGLPDEGDHLILRREVQARGRNRAWINGSPATAGNVGRFGRSLVDLHGQHDHQTLLREEEQRAILDAYAGAREIAASVRELHRRLRELLEEDEARAARVRELEARRDFLRFQADEIGDANPMPGEEEELEAELGRLDHAEELATGTEAIHGMLYSDDGSVSEVLSEARDRMRRLVSRDARLKELEELVDSAYHQVVEAGRSSGTYAAGVEVDPARAEELRARLQLLSRLRGKYGPELSDVIAAGARIQAELDELDRARMESGELERRIGEARSALDEAARELGSRRQEAARSFSEDVLEVLPELGMSGAVFRIDLEAGTEPGPHGLERVRYLASLNPGFDPRPLADIASGGELSRVMLALKSVLAEVDRVPTLIFDEVDAGVGGEVAHGVADRLERVSAHHQVLVITHLAQVASRGHRHLRVEKSEEEGVATTRVRLLEEDERIREIARMLGGDPGSSTSRRHAGELLERNAPRSC